MAAGPRGRLGLSKVRTSAVLSPTRPPYLSAVENTEPGLQSHVCPGPRCLLCLLPTLSVTSCLSQKSFFIFSLSVLSVKVTNHASFNLLGM